MVPESLNPVTIVIGLLLLNSGLLEAQKDRTILEDLVGWERFGFSDCNLEKLINCLKINVEGSLQFIHELVPDWLQVLVHGYCEVGVDLVYQFSSELCLIVMVLGTVAMIIIISRCLDRRRWETPLIKRLAETDRKLFVVNSELAIRQRETSETADAGRKEGEMVKLLNIQLDKVAEEILIVKEEFKIKEENIIEVDRQLGLVHEKLAISTGEIAERKTKVDKLLEKVKINENELKEKRHVIQQLEDQLEIQKELIRQFEPELQKIVNENEELSKENEDAQKELNHLKLNNNELKLEIDESTTYVEEFAIKIADMERKDEEWKARSDLQDYQLAEKNQSYDQLLSELSLLESKVNIIEVENEDKDKELIILNEALEEELRRKKDDSAEADGWDLDEDCLIDVDLEEVKEEARLRIKNKKQVERNEILQKKVEDLQVQLNNISHKATENEEKIKSLKSGKDEAVKNQDDASRKLEILTEFFDKKESELHKKLGLQSCEYGDVSSEAEATAKKLATVTRELELTSSQSEMLRRELDDQEKSLRDAFLEEQKKADQNWVAARQADRKVMEMQKEMGILRNRLTAVEGRKEIMKEDYGLSLNQVPDTLPPLPGLSGLISLPTVYQSMMPSLVPLPPLPGMSSLPPNSVPHTPMSYYPYQDTGSSRKSRSPGSYTRRRSRSPEHSGWISPPSPSRSSQASQWEGGQWYPEQRPDLCRVGGGEGWVAASNSDMQGRNWGV